MAKVTLLGGSDCRLILDPEPVLQLSCLDAAKKEYVKFWKITKAAFLVPLQAAAGLLPAGTSARPPGPGD